MNILNLNLENPIKSNKCYYSKCSDKITFQLNNVYSMNKIYKKENKLFIDVIINNKYIRKINNIEKLIKKECHSYYKIWNQKDISKDVFYKRYISIIENIIKQENNQEIEEEDIHFNYDTDNTDNEDDIISDSSEEEYISTFELDIIDNKIKTMIFNYNKSRISYKKINKYNNFNMIISFRGIKFGKTKFKPHFVINKIKLYKRDNEVDDIFKNKCYLTSDYENEAKDEGYLSYESENEREYVSKLIKKDIEKRKNKTFIDYLSD